MLRSLALALVLLAFVFPAPAHAYIDPGTGSMLVQIVFGAVIGGLFWFRRRLADLAAKIKSFFHRP